MGEITGDWGDIVNEVLDAMTLNIMNTLDNEILENIAKQAETSISLEDITKMCADYGAANPYSCGFSYGYFQQELPKCHYDVEFEMKFFDEVLKEPENISAAAKYDMAMKAVI